MDLQDLDNDNENVNEEVLEAPTHKGLIVAEDDLAVGDLLAVHSLKNNTLSPIMGQAFTITALCFPFFVGTLYGKPQEPVTFDTRFIRCMRVTEEFAKAQNRPTQKKGHQL